jgi:hypothetical protein
MVGRNDEARVALLEAERLFQEEDSRLGLANVRRGIGELYPSGLSRLP